jgi:hypothetical protein
VVGQVAERATVTGVQREPGAAVEPEHHLGIGAVDEIVDGEAFLRWQVEARVENHVAECGERDRQHDGVPVALDNLPVRLERQADPSIGQPAHAHERVREADRLGQQAGQPVDHALIALDHVKALVAEHAEGVELRAAVGVDEEKEVQQLCRSMSRPYPVA